jgi:hypothetical protein
VGPDDRHKKRYRIRRGSRVPYAEDAGIDLHKFTRYALRPDIDPGKANGFRRLLGITLDDWTYLADQLLERLPDSEATHACLDDPDYVEFSVPILVDGLNGKRRVVKTGWGVDSNHQPWLITAYATRRTSL